MATVANSLALKDIINPQFHQNNLPAELYVKSQLGIKLDKDDQICRLSLTSAGCPLGPLHCPLRHTTPSIQNFQPPKQVPTHPRDRERLSTVCKHWLRGLCKKGDACEFLHEYNLRRMPEYECLYAHPKERKVECPDYQRGFCKLGPECPRKHVRRVACQLYLTGMCPLGPECPRGHPKPDLPTQKDYDPPIAPTRDLGPPPPGYGRYSDFDRAAGSGPGFGNNPTSMPPRRNLDEVLCFKCGEKGHYANHCRNRNVPGSRGGVERRRYGGEE
ncbi:hypothetical protein IW261DRAFT_1483362 [Armillaria novae-zelandiae]|uniref:mRNA 3'-end-processing protein n=1 Tax=Armillaria novae-zelandiae TaxID=153914 RepID=A0AA39P6K9_9AGAR|nr:hypothetical protein IW261DRAFT_1483362 [Armillaria novae-zelandiae]